MISSCTENHYCVSVERKLIKSYYLENLAPWAPINKLQYHSLAKKGPWVVHLTLGSNGVGGGGDS